MAVNHDGLVFDKHAIGMIFIGVKAVDRHAVGFQSVDVRLLLLACQFNIGWPATEIPCEGLRKRRRDAADQRPLLLVQPHGGHV